jgi:hypothetical protein
MTETLGFWKQIQLELEGPRRRLRGLAMISHGIVPNLILSQRVVDKMNAAAQKFLADETGEAMIGFVVPAPENSEEMPTIYVLDTISPDETAVRQSHTFQQGDEIQDEIIWWLQENWRAYRQLGRDAAGNKIDRKFQVPLRYVGDWHKQPGYMIAPSGGDLMTALAWLDDDSNNMEYLLVPIVTLGHPPTTMDSNAHVNYMTVKQPNNTLLRVDWWYIHRDVRMFQPIRPVVVPEKELPALTKYPWHLVDEDRFHHEYDLLELNCMYISSIVLWESEGVVPLEICLMLVRPNVARVFLVITDWNYPNTPPRVRTAPLIYIDAADNPYDVFRDLWAKSEPVKSPPDWEWDSDKTLIDYVYAIEQHLGLNGPKLVKPEPEVIEIAVTIEGDDSELDIED